MNDTAARSDDLLRDALAGNDARQVEEILDALDPQEAARILSRMSDDQQVSLIELLPDRAAVHVLEALPDVEAAELVERLDPASAAEVVNRLPSNEQADLIGQLDVDDAEAILGELPPETAARTRELIGYQPDSAGGLMITEFLAYDADSLSQDVIDDLRINADQYRSYDIQYAFVIDASGTLRGVLPMRDLLLASGDSPIASMMIDNPFSVPFDAELDQLLYFFDRHPFFGVPVVDRADRLVGVVRRADVEEADTERASKSFLKFMGILGGEELRTMPLRLRSARRLSWLSINIVLNIIAASIIAVNQDTLQAVIALAVFLPIVSDMSGCSGNQAVAVSMRELALGIVRPGEVLRVLIKEASVGLLNGLVLGMLLGIVAYLWKGMPALGLVVAAALALNTVIAVSIGGTVPLLLRGLKQDPALASGPILTTITDMCGFFLVLTFARISLPWLVE